MTGFGSVRSEKEGHTLTIDMKCLNSKFMDISLRIPRVLQDKEANVRKILTDKIKRGKVQFSLELKLKSTSDEAGLINEKLFDAYYKNLSELASKYNSKNDNIFSLALHMPDVIEGSDEEVDDSLWKWVEENIGKAADKANDFRVEEGKSLESHFESSLKILSDSLEYIKELDVSRRKRLEDRLQSAIKDIEEKVKVDQNRFEQELIYYLEKLDISEEKVRLQSHLEHFTSTMKEKESAGKKLQFISQEMGREINTIGSKANDAEMQKTVVLMKDELEKIKEQTMNVL